MTYARNNATPRPILIGTIVQISDGAVQTTGVSVKVSKDGGAYAAGAGTTAVEEGEWSYTPSQGETDCETLRVILYKTACYSRSQQVVFSASSSFGHIGTDQSKIANPTSTVNLSNTTIKTATDVETKIDAMDDYIDTEVAAIKAKTDNLPSDPADASDIAASFVTVNNTLSTISGYIDTEVAAIKAKTDNLPANPAAVGDIPTAGAIADAVLEESVDDHDGVAQSLAKYISVIKKANTVIDGTVTSAATPTTTSFSSGVNYPTGAFKHAVLLFLDGNLSEQNSPILTYTNTNGVITVEEAFTQAPQTGDNFIIIPTTHVHAVSAIQNGLALEASSQSILARIGAFTGTGVNTILGFFRALLRSDASITTPSDVGGTYTHTTDSTQAIRDRGDAAWITGAGGGGGGSGAGTYPSLQVPPYPLAVYMTSDLFTYADIVQRLRDKRGLEGSARQMHALKVAVQDALTELAGRSTWRHYNRRVAVTTKAVVQKTASFDTATDILSIATGTWPTDAQYGEVVFDNQRYKVASRISDTELLLSSLTAPQASFTNKAVTWMQASYALPVMFRQIRSVIDEDAYRPLEYMSPADAVRHRKLARTTGQTLRYTLRSSENYMGLKEIEFSPVPAKATRFEIALIVRPRPFKTYELTGTDGAYTTGTQTFTSATAAFSATHVGCLLRISATATLPKGPTVFDESRVDFAVQAFITEVVSATEVNVSLPFTATASGKGYTVSDPADIDPTSMLAALDALAWEKYCLNIDMPAEALAAARVLAKEEFDRGIAADSADTNQPESAINYDVDTFEDFEPNVDVMGGQ